MVLASSISAFLHPILAGMAVLAALICSFLLVWSGLSYITSGGNVSRLMQAKRMIIRSLVGLAIVIGAASLGSILNHSFAPISPRSVQHLPSFNSVSTGVVSGGFVDVIIKAVTGLLGAIVQSAAKPFIGALQYFTNGTPLLVHNSSVVHLWLVAAAIADSLLALVIALIGFHIMGGEVFGIKDIDLKALLPQVLLVFVIVNTSIYLLDGIIELSNALIVAIRTGTGNLSPWQSLINIISRASGFSLPALLILIVFLVLTVILLVYYVARIITIYLGAVLAPFIVLLWLIPSFRDFAEHALKAYVGTVFVLFVHVVILALAGSLFAGVSQASGIKDPVMSLLLGLAAVVALLKTQGVLMQLNYASIGPRTARRLGGNFLNAATFIGAAVRTTAAETATSVSVIANSARSAIPTRNLRPISRSEPKE